MARRSTTVGTCHGARPPIFPICTLTIHRTLVLHCAAILLHCSSTSLAASPTILRFRVVAFSCTLFCPRAAYWWQSASRPVTPLPPSSMNWTWVGVKAIAVPTLNHAAHFTGLSIARGWLAASEPGLYSRHTPFWSALLLLIWI